MQRTIRTVIDARLANRVSWEQIVTRPVTVRSRIRYIYDSKRNVTQNVRVNREEVDARVSRRIYIRDISRHKTGDISCMSPRALICAGEETTPKGIACGGKRLTVDNTAGCPG